MSRKVNAHQRFIRMLSSLVDRIGAWVVISPQMMRARSYLPSPPAFMLKPFAPRVGPWNPSFPTVPTALQTVPGIWRDPAAEEAAYRAGPVQHYYSTLRPETMEWMYS